MEIIKSAVIKGKKLTIIYIIYLFRDILEHAEENKNSVFITTIDQWKAFDTIDHKYLEKMIKHVNFGDKMNKCLINLYDNTTVKIFVNDQLQQKIHVKSGIRQGCSVSMILYVLAIEELLQKIETNPLIKGYKYDKISAK